MPMASIYDVPREILRAILRFLGPREVLAVACSTKFWRLLDEDYIGAVVLANKCAREAIGGSGCDKNLLWCIHLEQFAFADIIAMKCAGAPTDAFLLILLNREYLYMVSHLMSYYISWYRLIIYFAKERQLNMIWIVAYFAKREISPKTFRLHYFDCMHALRILDLSGRSFTWRHAIDEITAMWPEPDEKWKPILDMRWNSTQN